MPRSKRDKEGKLLSILGLLLTIVALVSLTKVKKKTRETKENLIQEVRACVERYAHLFVFSIENMRSKKFLDVSSNMELEHLYY